MTSTLPTTRTTRLPSMAMVKWVVAREFGTTVGEIESHDRRAVPTFARQVAQTLAYEPGRRSYMVVGQAFEGRDHTTVMNAVEKVSRLAESDGRFASRLGRCREDCLRLQSVRSHLDDLMAFHRPTHTELRLDRHDAIIEREASAAAAADDGGGRAGP